MSQFNEYLSKAHWIAVKRVLRYLKETSNLGIAYKKGDKRIDGYVVADWGNCAVDRRSYTGYVFTFSGGQISWESKKQRTVALSSTEAKYMALTDAFKEAICLQKLIQELGMAKVGDIVVYNDNHGALQLAENPIFHARSKHIDIRYYFIRNLTESGELRTGYISTEDMIADIFYINISKAPKACQDPSICVAEKCLDYE